MRPLRKAQESQLNCSTGGSPHRFALTTLPGSMPSNALSGKPHTAFPIQFQGPNDTLAAGTGMTSNSHS